MGSTGIDELREQIALGCRILGATGHDDFVWGHVSARDPDGQGVWMKASTFGFEEVTAERIILVGFDGEVLAGDCPHHVEWQQMLTHAFGGPQRWSRDDEALRKRETVWSERQLAALWDYLVRRLKDGW